MTDPKVMITVNLLIVCALLIGLSHVGWLFPEPLFTASAAMS